MGGGKLPSRSRESLFVYGSLELAEVMRAVLGETFAARPATLALYRRRLLRDEVYPAMLADRSESVEGVLYQGVEETHLRILDLFEGDPYRRERVQVAGPGQTLVSAFAYVLRDEHASRLSDLIWDRDFFRDRHLDDFLFTCRRFRTSLAAGSRMRREIE